MRFTTTLMAVVLSLSLVPGAAAKPGNGKDKGGKGKPADSSTTFAVGQIVSTDNRILDVSGDYDLSTVGSTVSLSIIQDDRGRLSATATITSDDGSSSAPVQLTGHLQLTAQSRLRLQLNGKGVNIRGDWDGTAFQLSVKAPGVAPGSVVALTPVNTERGFTIEDSPWTEQGKKQLRSTRTVLLPWGSVTTRATQKVKGNSLTYSQHSSSFGIDLRGDVDDSTTFTATRTQIHTGFGSLRIPADQIQVSPSVTP